MTKLFPKPIFEVPSFLGWIIFNLLFAALIVACSEVGRLLGLPGIGLKISVFWPAAGIALSLLLLFGMRFIPGIFIGALIYNASYLIPVSQTLWIGTTTSVIISLGSTIQAALAYYILVTFASVDFYKRFQDTLIFLFPAGLLTCMVASALSVGALIIANYLPFSEGLYVWMTFWVGDTAGIYLITPLIIGFLLPNSQVYNGKMLLEAAILFLLLIGASFAIFFGEYPLAHLLVPFTLWGAFRFNIQGASSCLMIVSAIAIVATAMGHGPFVKFNTNESLFFLITFINMLSATTLVLIGILNERQKNAELLSTYNANLESMVMQRTKQLQSTREELHSKKKLASLGVLISGISHEISHPLSHINDLTKAGREITRHLKKDLHNHAESISEISKDILNSDISTIEECLQQIGQNEEQAYKIVKRILQQSQRDSLTLTEFHSIDLHNLLNSCITGALQAFDSIPPYTVTVTKEYDSNLTTIGAIGDDLRRVFFHVLENGLYALRQKMKDSPTDYSPELIIKTKDYNHTAEISIKDNGVGMSDAILRKIFTPFFSTKPPGESSGLGLALTYDIVVQEHHGTIAASSKKGVFTEVVITLPKVPEGEES